MKKNRQTLADFGVNQLEKITLRSAPITVELLNLGATIYSIRAPDVNGNNDDIVLGYPKWVDYLTNKDFLGCIVGRFANRIADASFKLGNRLFKVSANEGNNCLHGGFEGLHKKFYEIHSLTETSVSFKASSPDGEDGFPGNVSITVTYTLNESSLEIFYTAVSDADTVINLTNHSYFNLAGHKNGSVLEHFVQINAEKYLPVDEALIPQEPELTKDSPVDFTTSRPMSHILGAPHDQLNKCGGVDHCFILNSRDFDVRAAMVTEPHSGRTLEVYTTEPGIQLYTANHIDDMAGKDGAHYGKYPALCLETQHFPNSPNRSDFPSTLIKAGEVFKSRTHYRFGALS